MATAHTLERRETSINLVIGAHNRLLLRLHLTLTLQLSNGRAIETSCSNMARFAAATFKSMTLGIEPLADNATTTDDNRAMAIVQRGLSSLLKA